MPELQIDLAVANRFISSLSKSLQALCHGCMDFDSGIEIVGYININIDRGSKVDYVLNEKVLKSTTNSMTFVSNSFLAKKEQIKQTRDGACSPIPQPQVTPRMPPAYLNSRFQKTATQQSPYSHNLKGPQKRTRADDLKLSHKKQHLQSQPTESSATGQAAHSHLMSASSSSSYADVHSKQPESDNSTSDISLHMNIKQEKLEADGQNNFDGEHSQNPSDDQNLDSSLNQVDNVQVKPDPDETNSGSENTFSNNDSDNAATGEKADLKSNFLEPSLSDNQQSAEESCNQLESDSHSLADEANIPSTSRTSVAETDVDMSTENDPASGVSGDYDKSGDDGSYYQPGCDDAGEGSSDAGQFEVIEIDDEDEDVQAMFADHHVYSEMHRREKHQRPSATRMLSAENSVYAYQNFSCPCCFKTHADSSALRTHMAQFHKEKMPYSCNLCGKGYLSTSGLSRHMQSHKGKTFMCPICDSKFTQKFTVKSHLRTVHGLDQCLNCSAVLKLGLEFTQHAQNCDGNKFL